MKTERKRKVIDIEPWKEYYTIDNQTWEYVPIITVREIKLKGKISRRNLYFMKFYTQEGIQSKIAQVAGADSQYLLILADCIADENNQVMMNKFEVLVWMAQSNYYSLLKRLKDKAFIAKIEKCWYVNPYFIGYWKDIDEDVCKQFQEKTSQLYWIYEI